MCNESGANDEHTYNMPPRLIETAKGHFEAATALKVTGAVNGTRLELASMAEQCPRAIARGKRACRTGVSFSWLNGYRPMIFSAGIGYATPFDM